MQGLTSYFCLLIFALAPSIVHAQANEILDEHANQPVQGSVGVEELSRFAEVFKEVQKGFVEPVSDKKLMESAIKGLLHNLDPHSEYLSKKQLEQFAEDASGSYGGLGLEVQVIQGRLNIVSPMDDTPADRAGLKPNDVISRIDGVVIEGVIAFSGSDMLRGPVGSTVRLQIERAGQEAFEAVLKREVIQLKSAKAQRLPGGLAMLRVSAFQSDTVQSARAALMKLQTNKAIEGLVLDLRANPGGYVIAATGLADLFLESGVIVSTRGRTPESNSEVQAKSGDLINSVPMIVLIDAGSASAAEIVAGALQDHRRALIMGQKSFGKGSVQSLLSLSNGDALRLTTARYYTPSGKSIQARGILPDLPLAELRLSALDGGNVGAPVSESSLPNHLREEGESERLNSQADSVPLIHSDYAVAEAVNVLRALNLAKTHQGINPKPARASSLQSSDSSPQDVNRK
jgi:carboxyl-terminal processing protease